MLIEKIAVFGVRAQAQVLKAFKRRALPKQWYRRVGKPLVGVEGPIGAASELEMKRATRAANMFAPILGVPRLKYVTAPHIGKAWTAGKGDTVTQLTNFVSKHRPSRGKTLRSIVKTMKPEDRKAVNAIIKAHELDELNIPLKLREKGYLGALEHSGFEVMFRESNRVRALPKRMKAAKTFMKELHRGTTDELALKPVPGFRYGETKINRSARRRAMAIIVRHDEAILEDYSKWSAYIKKLTEIKKS